MMREVFFIWFKIESPNNHLTSWLLSAIKMCSGVIKCKLIKGAEIRGQNDGLSLFKFQTT